MMYEQQTTATNSEYHSNAHARSARPSQTSARPSSRPSSSRPSQTSDRPGQTSDRPGQTAARRRGNVIVEEANKGLMQLVEINRALAQDLDMSRRMVAELSREKDDLLEENEILRMEKTQFEMSDMARLRQDLRGFNSLGEDDGVQEELRQRLKQAERNAAAERARADMAEQQLRLLESEFESLVRERDTIMARLDESNLAMEEIRYRLASSMNDNLSFYDRRV